MDFFGAQDRARQRTGWLVALFALALAGIVAVVYAAAVAGMGGALWQPELFAFVTIGVTLVVGLASLSRTASLRRGGGASVAERLGGRRVEPNAPGSADRKLLNVVEETAIAAGAPVPAVYVLEHEAGINAFAAGYGPDDAVVAVTRGALDQLTRDELQGVVAHEFSHIMNRDMRLNIRLTGLIFGILALGLAGRLVLRSGFYARGGGKRGQGAAVALVLGLALLIAGYVGVLVGRIIRAAVSRQREFLADAAAVQFTRNPAGLAGALRKVGGQGSQLESAGAEEFSHFFFASGLRSGLAGAVLSTHPPLEERIARIEGIKLEGPPRRPAATRSASEAGALGFAGAPTASAPAAPRPSAQPERPAPRPIDAVPTGSVQPVPPALREGAHDPFSAVALCYAILIAADPTTRRAQEALLADTVSEPLFREVQRLLPHADTLSAGARLPLLDLAAPALRELSDAQADRLASTLDALAQVDQQLSIFEFALKTTVRYRLAATHGADPEGGRNRLDTHRASLYILLSALAMAGQEATEAVQAAFRAGTRPFVGAPSMPVACTADDVQHALDRLASLREADRERVLEACMAVVFYDRVLVEGEAYLMHAIAAALRLPVPAEAAR